jgi:alkanesulfonate monooxygenase SsuD/methylene tetrahydromethanopterin reductase-like flavin-dependent oxidoreductase (luciferase family)
MRLGIALPSFSSETHRLRPSELRAAIERVDGSGLQGVWLLEHMTRPSTYNTAWMEPLVTASWIAGIARGSSVGTSVLIAPLRNPAILVWQLLTLQYLIDTPLRLGFGAGYAPEEFELTAVPRTERGRRLDRFLEMFEEASVHGVLSQSADGRPITPVEIGPKSVHVPQIMVGGAARAEASGDMSFPPAVLQRILRWGGWISSPRSRQQLRTDWELVSNASPTPIVHEHLNYTFISDEADRSDALAEQMRAFEWLYPAGRGSDYVLENCLVGTREDLLASIEEIRATGVQTLILQLVAPSFDTWIDQVGRLESLLQSVDWEPRPRQLGT